jgi:hypothetical protein
MLKRINTLVLFHSFSYLPCLRPLKIATTNDFCRLISVKHQFPLMHRCTDCAASRIVLSDNLEYKRHSFVSKKVETFGAECRDAHACVRCVWTNILRNIQNYMHCRRVYCEILLRNRNFCAFWHNAHPHGAAYMNVGLYTVKRRFLSLGPQEYWKSGKILEIECWFSILKYVDYSTFCIN